MSNIIQLAEEQAAAPQIQQAAPVQQQQAAPVQIVPPSTPSAPAMEPLKFPSAGQVFAFRQLQSTGEIRFDYDSLESRGRYQDFWMAIILTGLLGVLIYGWEKILASRARRIGAIVIICLIAILFRAALDIAIPVFIIMVIYIILKLYKNSLKSHYFTRTM